MFKSEIEFLKHIRDEAKFIIEHTLNISKEDFLKDEVFKRASTRSLEIIGEAVKNLSKEFREQYPLIDWKSIAGTRDVVIHDYMNVDYDVIWEITQVYVPDLYKQVILIIEEHP